MNSMKEQTFGVEVEMILSREKAAKTIAEYFGTTARYVGGAYRAWKVRDLQGREWTVESDASIEAPSGEAQCEFVTPICHWDDLEPCRRSSASSGRRAARHTAPAASMCTSASGSTPRRPSGIW